MLIWSKRRLGTLKVLSGAFTWRCTLEVWQAMQACQQVEQRVYWGLGQMFLDPKQQLHGNILWYRLWSCGCETMLQPAETRPQVAVPRKLGAFFFYHSFILHRLERRTRPILTRSLRWSTPVGLKPAYTRMWVARSTTVLLTRELDGNCISFCHFLP